MQNSDRDKMLIYLVPNCTSYAQVLRGLGLHGAGENHLRIKRRINELGLDVSHFTGPGWNKGMPGIKRPPDELVDLLVYHPGRVSHTDRLKKKLINAGVMVEQCSVCLNVSWMGEKIPLQLDHVNGDREDDRLENLRLLCPNCHAQTGTYRGRNIKR